MELAGGILAETVKDKEVTVSIGVARLLEEVMNLKEGYEQAGQALEIGRMVHGPGHVTHFDDLGVYRILADSNQPELERFSRDLLAGLIESDQRTSAELLRTLEVVLRCNGNLRLAARELYVHYNTLRYRVARIQDITKVDLGTAEGRLNLQIALKILRIQKGR